jgi:tetrahydromethanopterin S-methyltransferase subunit F
MRIFTRKSELERLIDSVGDSLSELSDGLTKSRLLKAGLIAGGLAGLTAGSAGISSLRRRKEGVGDDS